MRKLKVCFVGVGSIAKRHIRNLRDVCYDRQINLQIDAFRRYQSKVDGIDNVFNMIEDVSSDYDVIFITNPTEQHLSTLQQFHDKGKHFFIEKPIVSICQIEKAKQLQQKKDSVYYVACPLRYNAAIQFIKTNINPDDVISVRSISSSYLPDWRPNQDYRNTYSAHRDMGGGVSIDLIHEWDYLVDLFGWPEKVFSMLGKKSSLEIDSDDYAIYIAETSNKIIELHLDYFGRKAIRIVELIMRDDTVVFDLINNKASYLLSGKEIEFKESRDDYQKRELNHFLDLISDDISPISEINQAIKILELTQGIV